MKPIFKKMVLAALVLAAGTVQAQVKLTLGHNAAVGNPKHEASVKFADIVKEKSGGKMLVQVAPAAQLGDDVPILTSLRSGTVDFAANSQGSISSVIPEYSAFGMPFLFPTLQDAWTVLDGPVGQELAKRSAEKGLIVLGYWDNGIRHISNKVRPINVPADLKGLKIRTPPDAVTIDIMQALGAEAQQIKLDVHLPQRCQRPWVNLLLSKISPEPMA